MSQENVELFRRAIEAYNRRDIEALLVIWHPEAEWYPFTAQVEGDDAYHGHEGLRGWWANVDATFEEIEASVEEVRDLGDTVLALGRLRARFRSGVTLDSEIGWLTRYRGGLGVWGRAYQSHAEALEAAGLSEYAMSEENVEIVRRAVAEFQAGMERGDPGAFFDSEAVADDYEWIFEGAELDGRSVWRGREGFEEFMRTWIEEFEGWSIRFELIDAGDDRVVGLTHQSATGKESGVPVELNIGQIYELEDGRVVRATNYLSHAEALEAADLSE